ncbi:SWI/SNF chromatin-remodeling complex subunit sol1 [Venturia nashicola]|uniref:SWI/SNF chromatin-remodeling complex subunit sol1 n=1 Tax=Venturia nashicola TaxID=86259 RepID=A0A4Z1NIK0_9PEZI|nr:SWI/SNF chromatin-remodeling complex subunit sol1 [Venturia nashicola]
MNGFSDTTAFDTSYMFNNNQNNHPSFQNAQYQQQQAALQQQHHQQQRSQTPQFPYPVNPVVPSKRSREDGIAASPRQTPSNLNPSRSQTPQQAGYPGGSFQGNQQGQQLHAPNPYQHLQQQHGSANATPSPTLSNQQFRPPARNSPNPHFPMSQQQAQQQQQSGLGTPDANGRVGTPQNAQFMAGQMNSQLGGQGMPSHMGPGANFMPGQQSMPQGYNAQNFGGGAGGMPNMSGGQMPYSAAQVQLTPNLASQQAEAHRLHTMKQQMQHSQQMQQNRARQQQQAAMGNPMMAGPGSMQTPTRPQGPPGGNMQAQQMQSQQQRMMEEQKFLQNVHKYMASGGRQFNPQPQVGGRPISLFALFTLVMRAKGSKRITMGNQWIQVAQRMGYQPEQYPNAAMEIKDTFEKNLGPWEAATYANAQAQQKMKMEQMQQQQQQMGGMGAGQVMSPDRAMPQTPQGNHATQQYMHQLQQRMNAVGQQQPPTPQQMTPVQNNASLPGSNGWATPQTDPAVMRPQTALDQHRKSVSYKLEGSPALPKPAFATPPLGKLERSASVAKMTNGTQKMLKIGGPEQEETTNHEPRWNFLEDSWGGIDGLDNRAREAEKLVTVLPNVPNLEEMGNTDIHALTLSLQSGIHSEMRYALDVLVKMTHHRQVLLELDMCEDLIDILLDCAEDQVEILAEEAPEVSDILDLGSYEDVLRNVKLEVHGLQDIPEVGTLAWQLDRAADRLIAITTILRNLSDAGRYSDKNQFFLANSKPVIKFLSSSIRLLGTRNMFLRSYVNASDFMKDVVIILSNISDKTPLPSREDAFNILQFLLSFAPGPSPASTKPLRFSHYDVEIHKYYPPAIDSLAKLLARDDPNRTFYKHLFLDNIPNSPNTPPYQQYELLTQTFGFAIAVLPERPTEATVLRTCEARKPILTQGLLAADILSILVPGVEVGLAKDWIASEDAWAPALLRLSASLASRDGQEKVRLQMDEARLQQARGGVVRQPPPINEDNMFGIVTHRALGMLKRLGGKAIDSNALSTSKADDSDSDSDDDVLSANKKSKLRSLKEEGVDEEVDGEWEGRLALSGFNGEMIPKQATVMGAVIDISLDQVVLREMIALGDLAG